MPIKVKNNFPAKKILEDENIFIMDETGLCLRISARSKSLY